MIGITFDMDDLGRVALRKIAFRVHDDAAGNRTIRAGIAGFRRPRELERAYGLGVGGFNIAKSERAQGCPRHARTRADQKLAPRDCDVHGVLSPCASSPYFG